MDLIIGFDVGTTTVKGAVFDLSGNVIASYREDYTRARALTDWVEQDPEDWTRILHTSLNVFREKVDLARVVSLAVCSQVNTHVFADQDGAPLIPAIVWQDTRAKEVAARLDASFTLDQKMAIWGTDFVLDASFALSRAVWVAENLPDVWGKTHAIMSPKDYCNLALCGVATSDALSSVGLAGPDNKYVSDFGDILPGFDAKLPPLRDLFEVIGETNLAEFPDLKAKVINSTMDAWAGFFGCGMAKAGDAVLMAGTSSIVGVMSADAIPTRGVITFPKFADNFVHAGPTQSGSDSLNWLSRILGRDLDDILQACSSHTPADSAPLFLPHLDGERAPIWDPIARGCFIGLNGENSWVDIAYALLEGVAFSERHLMEECSNAAGFYPKEVRLSGGGSHSDFWSQMRADVLGQTLHRSQVTDAGMLGAAIIAAVGAEQFTCVQTAIALTAKSGESFAPDAAKREQIDARYALYREAFHANYPLFTGLDALGGQ